MYLIPFEKLYNTDFIITEPMAKTQFWYNRGSIYNSLDKPKISHTLLWFKNCSAVITDSLGHILHVKQNQLTYMAKGIKYKVDFFDTAPDREDTVVIHTKLVKYNGIKMEVEYIMTDKETGELRTKARSSHCFLNKSGKPISLKRSYPEIDTKFFEFKEV